MKKRGERRQLQYVQGSLAVKEQHFPKQRVEKKNIDKLTFYDGLTVNNAIQGIEVNADGTILFGYRQQPNAIENISETTIENAGDGYYYDLQGRRVLNPTRGIYIHNGKKIVVK